MTKQSHTDVARGAALGPLRHIMKIISDVSR